jgi:hypothetical protein
LTVAGGGGGGLRRACDRAASEAQAGAGAEKCVYDVQNTCFKYGRGSRVTLHRHLPRQVQLLMARAHALLFVQAAAHRSRVARLGLALSPLQQHGSLTRHKKKHKKTDNAPLTPPLTPFFRLPRTACASRAWASRSPRMRRTTCSGRACARRSSCLRQQSCRCSESRPRYVRL